MPTEAAPSPADNRWWIYIVRCADGTLYTGIARDCDARLAEHNAGSGAKYTRSRRPVEIVYTEPADSRATALRREHAIKRLTRAGKTVLIAAAERAAGQRIASGRNGEPVAPLKRIGVAINRNS